MGTPQYLIEAELYAQRNGQGTSWATHPVEVDGLNEALVFTASSQPSDSTQQEIRKYVNQYTDWALFQRKSAHEQYLQLNKPEEPSLPSGISVKRFRE